MNTIDFSAPSHKLKDVLFDILERPVFSTVTDIDIFGKNNQPVLSKNRKA